MQKLNCTIGDLAIVTTAEQPENLGQIVEILGTQTDAPFSLSGPGHVWQVRTVSGRRTLAYWFKADGHVVRCAVGPAPDCRLRPVSGLQEGKATESGREALCAEHVGRGI
jgi:hypothetical protein